jgi:hypothetical protein
MIIHPSLRLLSPKLSRTDLFTVVFCIVDDWMKSRFGASNYPRRHRGPRKNEFSDSETLTILIVGEICQCRRERGWLRQVRANHLSLFPRLPEDSRFSRRAEQVRFLLADFRRSILFWADADIEPIRILDSFPMPLCACYRIRQSTLPISSSNFGYNSSKKIYYFGLRPDVLMTASGFIEDIILSPGNCTDARFLGHYLDQRIEQQNIPTGRDWIMDKGYVNNSLAQWAKQHLNLNLLARQRDKDNLPPSFWQELIDITRKPIEGVISNLTEYFGIEHLLVKTDIGLFRRTQAKATAISIMQYFNRALGRDTSIANYAV